MRVRPIEPGRGQPLQKPPEERLVTDVHTQRDVRLAPVTAERPLADQHADDHPAIEVAQRGRRVCDH